ncbi:MAG: outer membrane protein assembly factor BamA, partial [Alphaproteobacteria bacterium]|nr:outer membrane protein assembly factor BamA [Alphaproteobacteria bacterium]
DIKGNNRTHSNVIMREISLQEGDAFNMSKIRDSERNIRELGYFKEATIESEPGDNPDQAKLKVQVEEQRTGELKLTGGFSTTDGFMAGFGVSERNFMGKGQIVHADLGISRRYQDINVGITEPYLFNRPLIGSIDLYSTRSSRVESYVTKSTGTNIGLGYHITQNLTQRFTYSIHKDSVSQIANDASPHLQNDPRNSIMSSLNHNLTYDRRDNTQDPTRGYVISLSNTYAGLGGNVRHVRNDVTGTIFYTPIEDLTLLGRLAAGRLDRVGGKRIRIVDAIYLGGDTLRGFEYAGVGPRDSRGRKDALGGRKYWKGTVEAQFPVGLPVDFGVKGALFTDFGSVWHAPVQGHVIDTKKVRMSWGASIIWKGPFGPLRIDYAIPFKKTPHDETQRINLGYALPL